jgi:proton glutamate symport protein
LNQQRRVLTASLILAGIAAVLGLADIYGLLEIPSPLLMASRWLFGAAIIGYAVKKRSLTTWIMVSMLAGIEIGHTFPAVAVELKILSQIFLKLIKAVIAPILFATLVVGIAGHSDMKQVGRMGWKSLVYFEVVTTIALFIGLAAINISKAGVGIVLPPDVTNSENLKPVEQTWQDIVLHIFPENFASAVAEGQVLQIVVFSILFGMGLAVVEENKRKTFLSFTESLAEVMFKFTNIIMYFAPIGVLGAIAYTVGNMGFGVLKNLLQLLATLYVALFVFLAAVLIPIMIALRINIRKFWNAVSEPVSIAFGTSTSEAALPKAMEALEKYGVPRKIVAFVLPTGYSFNLDGTTLYLSLASVFVAQAAGVNLSIGQQLFMCVTLMLTSKGVAGVSRASLVILLGTVASFNLPVEPVFLILGIDQLMDMARTAVNVFGNCLATVVVAKWEGELKEVSDA